MKFQFRLETVLRQRKVEQDLAQRDYQIAQGNVNDQLSYIKKLYRQSDEARERAGKLQLSGGEQVSSLNQIEEFISLQKIKIQREREKARGLMQIAEEKHEILVDKSKDLKILEKLKERQKEDFKKEQTKREVRDSDDITIMRQRMKG